MLHEFDDLAAAELEDMAMAGRGAPARPVSTRPAVKVRASRSASSGWDWLLGACVLGLVVLAARS